MGDSAGQRGRSQCDGRIWTVGSWRGESRHAENPGVRHPREKRMASIECLNSWGCRSSVGLFDLPARFAGGTLFTARRRGANMATAVTAPSMDSNVSSFVARKQKLLINGKWVDAASGKTFATYNPATGEVLANVAEGDREDIDRAVKAARAAFETGPWSKTSPAVRGKMIWKLADLIEKHLEEFAQLESLDNGKPLAVARVADVPLTIEHMRYYAGW